MKNQEEKEIIEYSIKKLVSNEEIATYLEVFYGVTLPKEDKKKDLFPILLTLSSKEMNKVVNENIEDKKRKLVYHFLVYRENKKNKAYFYAYDKLKALTDFPKNKENKS